MTNKIKEKNVFLVGSDEDRQDILFTVCCELPVFFLEGGTTYSVWDGDKVVDLTCRFDETRTGGNFEPWDKIDVILTSGEVTEVEMYDIHDKDPLSYAIWKMLQGC